MSLEDAPLEPDDDADQNWFAPIAMFIAWLAHLFEQIPKLKRVRRTTKFKSSWRDHWPDLRQCEWMRDQILASGAAQLLAGKALDLDAFIPSSEPPANYGGPCPATPFEMNRRFLAMARFNADPEPAIRAHAKRIAQRERIDLDSPLRHDATHRDTSPGFAGGGKAPAPLASLADRRGSNHVDQVQIAGVQGVPLLRTRFAASMIFRMTATRTTLGGLPRAVSRSAKALRPGSVRRAASAAM